MIDAFLMAGGRRPEELASVLRLRFPDALVRPRDLAGERVAVRYVYRDGHWISEGEALSHEAERIAGELQRKSRMERDLAAGASPRSDEVDGRAN